MLTFVTTFKPFIPPYDVIQLNALKSWLRFCPPCEIVVVGAEEGVEEMIKRFRHVKLVGTVKRSPYGAPLLNDVIKRGEEESSNELICLINGDIILLSDFLKFVNGVRKRFDKFFLTCRRFDLEISEPLNFDSRDTEVYLRSQIEKKYSNIRPRGTDVFVYNKGFLSECPPLAIGRLIWSRWLIYHALLKKIPTIDATGAILAIHQIHSYEHIGESLVKAALPKVKSAYTAFMFSQDYKRNLLIGGVAAYFSEEDCDYLLTRSGLKKRTDMIFLLRRVLKKPLFIPFTRELSLAAIRVLLPSRYLRAVLKRKLFSKQILY